MRARFVLALNFLEVFGRLGLSAVNELYTHTLALSHTHTQTERCSYAHTGIRAIIHVWKDKHN